MKNAIDEVDSESSGTTFQVSIIEDKDKIGYSLQRLERQERKWRKKFTWNDGVQAIIDKMDG